jgi:LysM repeat protein
VVARGESLYSISKQFNVSVPDLMSWNGLSRSSIKSGDVIVIWTPRAPVEARMP